MSTLAPTRAPLSLSLPSTFPTPPMAPSLSSRHRRHRSYRVQVSQGGFVSRFNSQRGKSLHIHRPYLGVYMGEEIQGAGEANKNVMVSNTDKINKKLLKNIVEDIYQDSQGVESGNIQIFDSKSRDSKKIFKIVNEAQELEKFESKSAITSKNRSCRTDISPNVSLFHKGSPAQKAKKPIWSSSTKYKEPKKPSNYVSFRARHFTFTKPSSTHQKPHPSVSPPRGINLQAQLQSYWQDKDKSKDQILKETQDLYNTFKHEKINIDEYKDKVINQMEKEQFMKELHQEANSGHKLNILSSLFLNKNRISKHRNGQLDHFSAFGLDDYSPQKITYMDFQRYFKDRDRDEFKVNHASACLQMKRDVCISVARQYRVDLKQSVKTDFIKKKRTYSKDYLFNKMKYIHHKILKMQVDPSLVGTFYTALHKDFRGFQTF